jgi:hypothetical protein
MRLSISRLSPTTPQVHRMKLGGIIALTIICPFLFGFAMFAFLALGAYLFSLSPPHPSPPLLPMTAQQLEAGDSSD